MVSRAMALLESHHHRGYFEVIAQDIELCKDSALNIDRDFQGFKTAEPSPRYRNHLIYEGKPEGSDWTFYCVPSHASISIFSQNFNVKIDMVVDYSPAAPIENSAALILRVATVNHTLREKALESHLKLQKLSNANPIINDARNYKIVTEQCLVGEPTK